MEEHVSQVEAWVQQARSIFEQMVSKAAQWDATVAKATQWDATAAILQSAKQDFDSMKSSMHRHMSETNGEFNDERANQPPRDLERKQKYL